MTLKELFKKHNAQPGFKFTCDSWLPDGEFNEVLAIGQKYVFVVAADGSEFTRTLQTPDRGI